MRPLLFAIIYFHPNSLTSVHSYILSENLSRSRKKIVFFHNNFILGPKLSINHVLTRPVWVAIIVLNLQAGFVFRVVRRRGVRATAGRDGGCTGESGFRIGCKSREVSPMYRDFALLKILLSEESWKCKQEKALLLSKFLLR